jgi:hypothetical protein
MTDNHTPQPSDEKLTHVGWWCWRGDNHGHLATQPCRSDNVPLHAPAEWADEMRAVIQRIEDGDDGEPAGPDDTDLTETDVDRMMAAGVPVQIVTAPPLTWTTAQAFHEADEDPAAVKAAFEAGAKGVTASPADQAAPTVWIDRHPQLEAIAAAVWERCRTEESSLVVDDPRNIAVAAFAAVLAVLPAGSEDTATTRADALREAADICDEAGAVYASKGCNDQADAAYRLMERFQRKADEAEYVATPCSPGGCEPGGEPCTTHERLMAHAEGDHELCAPDCGLAAAGSPQSDDYEATTGHLITCFAVAGGNPDPDCPCAAASAGVQTDEETSR